MNTSEDVTTSIAGDDPKDRSVRIARIKIPSVSPNPFMLSVGLYRYGVPELVATQLEVNEASMALMQNATLQLQRALEGPEFQKNWATQLLTTPGWRLYLINSFAKDGTYDQLRTGLRKLTPAEEYLLKAQVYEFGLVGGHMNEDQLLGISTYGFTVIEIADKKGNLPGTKEYDLPPSVINTIVTH